MLSHERKREFKDASYLALAALVGGVDASLTPRRLELMDLLAQRPRSPASLAEEAATTEQDAATDLAALVAAQLARALEGDEHDLTTEGRALLTRLHAAAREDPGIQAISRRYLGAQTLSSKEIEDLPMRVLRGEVILLDVRPSAERGAGSVPGSQSAPLDDIDEVARGLPPATEVVAMCRGPFCCWADAAAMRLEAKGFRARVAQANVDELAPDAARSRAMEGGC